MLSPRLTNRSTPRRSSITSLPPISPSREPSGRAFRLPENIGLVRAPDTPLNSDRLSDRPNLDAAQSLCSSGRLYDLSAGSGSYDQKSSTIGGPVDVPLLDRRSSWNGSEIYSPLNVSPRGTPKALFRLYQAVKVPPKRRTSTDKKWTWEGLGIYDDEDLTENSLLFLTCPMGPCFLWVGCKFVIPNTNISTTVSSCKSEISEGLSLDENMNISKNNDRNNDNFNRDNNSEYVSSGADDRGGGPIRASFRVKLDLPGSVTDSSYSNAKVKDSNSMTWTNVASPDGLVSSTLTNTLNAITVLDNVHSLGTLGTSVGVNGVTAMHSADDDVLKDLNLSVDAESSMKVECVSGLNTSRSDILR